MWKKNLEALNCIQSELNSQTPALDNSKLDDLQILFLRCVLKLENTNPYKFICKFFPLCAYSNAYNMKLKKIVILVLILQLKKSRLRINLINFVIF